MVGLESGITWKPDGSGIFTLEMPLEPSAILVLVLIVAALSLVHLWDRKAHPKANKLPKRGVNARVGALLKSNYLSLLLWGGSVVVLGALYFLFPIPGLIAAVIEAMRTEAESGAPRSTNIRNLAYAFTALTGALAILATIPFQLIRAWINERTTRTAEENLVTDLINKAVEGLGAEKTMSRIGRSVTYQDVSDPPEIYTATEIEWQGHALRAGSDEVLRSEGEWKAFETTAPNLEVRLGAIYALERIAQDSDRDHVRIMEILCAYIRQNAPADEAKDHNLGEWPKYPFEITFLQRSERTAHLARRREKLIAWLDKLDEPRLDIVAALDVIFRRSPIQIELEQRYRDDRTGRNFQIDLRGANLRKADLSGLDLTGVLLNGARLEGTNFRNAKLDNAILDGAHLEGAVFGGAEAERLKANDAWLEAADLTFVVMPWAEMRGSKLHGAYLGEARMPNASFNGAHFERAVLWHAQMREADFSKAHMNEADLRAANVKASTWTNAHLRAPAHDADMRGARSLTQVQLENVIGNIGTLLPIYPDENGERYYVWSCWAASSEEIATLAPPDEDADGRASLSMYVESEWTRLARTGTCLPQNAPYPEDHPLGRWG